MARRFLLLEIVDPEVATFLWAIREILTGAKVKGPIHVTLRGPYESEGSDFLAEAQKRIRNDVLRIARVGRFSNAGEEVVYFHVDSPNLRKVWWKPHYPGFRPHISVYRGPDKKLADRAAKFLHAENIELFCAEHRLIWYKSGQANLLARNVPSIDDRISLIDSGRIDVGLLDRLQELVDEHRAHMRSEVGSIP